MKKENIGKFRIAVLVLSICAVAAGCAGKTRQHQAEQPQTQQPQTQQPQTRQPQMEVTASNDSEVFAEVPESMLGWYFKEGDFRYRMRLLPGEEPPLQSDRQSYIQMVFSVREEEEIYREWSNALRQIHLFDIPYSGQGAAYTVQDTGDDGTGAEYLVTMNEDGTVMLQGDTEEAGLYYSFKDNLMMPEQYQRPLNDTDLIGLEKADLRLLRNEIYAVYGRKFNSRDLQACFEGKDWYMGVTEPENFDETVLGGMMKRNVAFLKDAEASWDEETAEADRQAYRALKPAPYVALLPEQGEILVTLSSNPEEAEDRGIYIAAKGSISVPITVSAEEYRRLEAGNPIELTVDELTGETAILKKSRNSQYGSYCLGDEPLGNYVEASYDRLAGNWYLWGDSADTRFKRVYEGDIYVLKGATEEYYQYFDLPAGQRMGPGNYRVMDFRETDTGDEMPYSGNILVADANGYVKALYFWGD